MPKKPMRRKRKIFFVFAFLALFFIYYLTSFIWFVEIQGTQRTATREVYAFLKENSVFAGAKKRGLKNRDIEKEMLLHFGELSWVNLTVKGTNAVLTVIETKPAVEIIDKDTPCDIISANDAVITKMAVSAGTPLVSPGDEVKKGDVLVSAEIKSGTPDTQEIYKQVHARAEIKAKVYYEFAVSVPLVYEEPEYTGKTRKALKIAVFDKEINIIKRKVPYLNYERIVSVNTLKIGENYPLPFSVITVKYKEFVLIKKERDVDSAAEYGMAMITGRIIAELEKDAVIIEREDWFSETHEAVGVKTIITVEKRVDVERVYTP